MTQPEWEPWATLGMSKETWERLLEADKRGRQERAEFVPTRRQVLWYRLSQLLERLSYRVARWSRYCLLKASNW